MYDRPESKGERIGQGYADRDIYPSIGYQVRTRENADRQHDVDLICDRFICSAEEKFMRRWHDHLLIEVVQDASQHPPDMGWLYDVAATYLHLFYCTEDWRPLRMVGFRWGELCAWLREPANWDIGRPRMSVNGYGVTLYVTWPLKVLPRDLWRECWCEQLALEMQG